MRFEHSFILYFLFAVPVFTLLFIYTQRKNLGLLRNYTSKVTFGVILPDKSISKPWLKFLLFLFAYVLFVLSLANPQSGTKLQEAKSKGAQIMIALDVSNSMRAQDLQPSRLEHCKRNITRLISNLQGDKLGIVIFAGSAYVQLPLTADYSAARLFLDQIDFNSVPTQGTAIGKALETCIASFDKKNDSQKVIILISDGENFEDDAITAAGMAKAEGILIHSIGAGSEAGSPIPDIDGNILKGYKRNAEGNTVITRLNEPMLQQISAITKGFYVREDQTGSGLIRISDSIGNLKKTEYASKTFTDYDSKFQWILFPCLILLITEIFISEKRSKWWDKLKLFENKKA